MIPDVSGRVAYGVHHLRQLATVSEIHITECAIDPWFVPSIAADLCYPSTTKEEDALKGKWVRVEHNLKEQATLKSLVRPSFPGYSWPL